MKQETGTLQSQTIKKKKKNQKIDYILKFEQLLQIYWSRGFLYGGKIKTFNVDLKNFVEEKPGLSDRGRRGFESRFELSYLHFDKEKTLLSFSLETRKVMNMYLSQIVSINSGISELIKYNMIRLYLIKTFKGRCFALGKPSRGQRTRSNGSTAYKYNKVIKIFIQQVKKNNVIEKKPENLNKKILQKKVKKSSLPKIKMMIIKKKKNLWF